MPVRPRIGLFVNLLLNCKNLQPGSYITGLALFISFFIFIWIRRLDPVGETYNRVEVDKSVYKEKKKGKKQQMSLGFLIF